MIDAVCHCYVILGTGQKYGLHNSTSCKYLLSYQAVRFQTFGKFLNHLLFAANIILMFA